MQGEHPFAVQSSLLCHLGSRCDEVLGQSRKVVLVVDYELEGVCLCKHILSEGELQHRDFLIELAQLLLLVGIEVGTAAHETLVCLFEELLLFLVELFLRLVVIHVFHTLEEGGVHRDVVAVLREQWRNLAAHCLHLVAGAGTVLTVEHRSHLVEQFATAVEGCDGVLECGRFLVIDDSVNLLFVFLHTLDEGRFVMFHLYLLKRRDAVGRGVLAEEGVASLGHHTAANDGCGACCDNCFSHIY